MAMTHKPGFDFAARAQSFSHPLYRPSAPDAGPSKWAKTGPQNVGARFTVQTPGGQHRTVTTAQLDAKPQAPKHLMGTELMAWQKTHGLDRPRVDFQAKHFVPAEQGQQAQMFDQTRGKQLGLDVLLHGFDVATLGASFVAKNVATGGALVAAGLGTTKVMMKEPINVAITGGTGKIGYMTAFETGAGRLFGADQPVNLRLLARPESVHKLPGLVAELKDTGSPLLREVTTHTDPHAAFDGAHHAILIASAPRTADIERAQLLEKNARIFVEQGNALNRVADPSVKVLVVGNPANTNAWIAQQSAPRLNPEHFTALMRLDHNRTVAQLTGKAGVSANDVSNVIVWGNHSPTMVPDISFASLGGRPAFDAVGRDWYLNTLVPTVRHRGKEIIELSGGKSSVGSTTAAITNHMFDWTHGTPRGQWTTMGVPSNGAYGVPKGLIAGFPVTIGKNGSYKIVDDLRLDPYAREQLGISVKELIFEQSVAQALLK